MCSRQRSSKLTPSLMFGMSLTRRARRRPRRRPRRRHPVMTRTANLTSTRPTHCPSPECPCTSPQDNNKFTITITTITTRKAAAAVVVVVAAAAVVAHRQKAIHAVRKAGCHAVRRRARTAPPVHHDHRRPRRPHRSRWTALGRTPQPMPTPQSRSPSTPTTQCTQLGPSKTFSNATRATSPTLVVGQTRAVEGRGGWSSTPAARRPSAASRWLALLPDPDTGDFT